MKRAAASCKPTKMWIDGKTYELNKFHGKPKKMAELKPHTNSEYEMNKNDEGKVFTSFSLPSPYYKKLSSFPGWNLKDLQSSTNTSINIPTDGNLVIMGDSENEIVEARDVVHSVIGEIRNQCMALQFVSIPTLSDEIVTHFEELKNEILNGEEIPGMHESIFMSAKKLHLTVAVFSLIDEKEKSVAIQALQDYKTDIFDSLIKRNGAIKIKVSGIDCMNQNLKKVDVLYANAQIVDESQDFNLQNIANGISDHFYDRGLMKGYQENVKLHMTLINTKYRKSSGSPNKKRWNKRQSIDASKIMERYKDFYFGECFLNSIHLSLISSVGEDGFYKPLCIINLD